jgi:hypothetical protein
LAAGPAGDGEAGPEEAGADELAAGEVFSSLEAPDSPLGSEEDLETPVAPTVDFLESLM